MKRRLFNLLAAISLLLCMATAGMWVRGSWRSDALYLITPYHSTALVTSRGIVRLWRVTWCFTPSPLRMENGLTSTPEQRWNMGHDADDEDGAYEWTGAVAEGPWAWLGSWGCKSAVPPHYFTESPPEPDGWEIHAPYSFLLLFFAAGPAWAVSRALHQMQKSRRAARTGLCAYCGYDLRATPDKCPECGTVPDKPPKGST